MLVFHQRQSKPEIDNPRLSGLIYQNVCGFQNKAEFVLAILNGRQAMATLAGMTFALWIMAQCKKSPQRPNGLRIVLAYFFEQRLGIRCEYSLVDREYC